MDNEAVAGLMPDVDFDMPERLCSHIFGPHHCETEFTPAQMRFFFDIKAALV